MANAKRTANLRSFPCTGKQSLLPPKSPFRCTASSNTDCGFSSVGPKGIPRTTEDHMHLQHIFSENFLAEEQFSWLDDLLNEPEAPMRGGTHRRSSSDSFAYLETSGTSSNVKNLAQEECKHENLASASSWGSLDFDRITDLHDSSFCTENSFGRHQNVGWETLLNSVPYLSRHSSAHDNTLFDSSGHSGSLLEPDAVPSIANKKKQDHDKSGQHVSEVERSDCSYSKPSATETDSKQARQKYAQRSRVRKLEYIAELERTVQTLQAQGSEVLGDLNFLEQQNLILNMENKALKQRVDSLAQAQLVKYLEQGVLERERTRLRAILYEQQHQNQQEQHPPSIHRRCSSRDLDSQFATLSLKHKEANSARESVGGPLWI